MRGVRGVYPVVMATLVLIALSVGCLGGPEGVADRDVVVLKLAADGAPKWTRTIDTGEDDGADDLIELSDGGFAIAAQNGSDPRGPARPRIVRLAPDGTVLWDRFVTDGTEIARAIVPTGDGGMAVLTGNGTVVRFDGKGRTDWARATGMTEAQALLALADGGFIAGGDVTYHATTNITVPPVPGRSVDPRYGPSLHRPGRGGCETLCRRRDDLGAPIWRERTDLCWLPRREPRSHRAPHRRLGRASQRKHEREHSPAHPADRSERGAGLGRDARRDSSVRAAPDPGGVGRVPGVLCNPRHGGRPVAWRHRSGPRPRGSGARAATSRREHGRGPDAGRRILLGRDSGRGQRTGARDRILGSTLRKQLLRPEARRHGSDRLGP